MEPTTNAPNSFANGSGLTPPLKKGKKLLKIFLILVGFIIVVGAVWVGVYYFLQSNKKPEVINRENLIQTQLAEIERMRAENGYVPPTDQIIKQQLTDIDKMRKQNGYVPPTNEQITKQIEELNKLKTN